jgi:prefoldin subunit 5
MREPKTAFAFLVVALLGGAAAFPAATLPAADIQSLSSAVAGRTAPTTVSTQFGDLLRRHAAAQLPIGAVENALNLILKESISQADREKREALAKIAQLNEVAEALSSQLSEFNARSTALSQLVNTTDTALTVTHGDRVVSAAEQANVALERLVDKLDSLSELSAASRLELQQALNRLQQMTRYLSQVTRALNDVIKASIGNFKA